jgi:DNA (cytosine-5)-methyltransferase 1
MRVGSLFSGIGGIELGLERAGGFETAWFVEWDAYAQAVLRKHWPGVPVYGDVRSIDWATVEPVDVLTGGFPCQDASIANPHGEGISGQRTGLWKHYLEAVRILRPKFVIAENVPNLLNRGFEEVVSDLASVGYDAEWQVLPAGSFGASHKRERLWVVAYPVRFGLEGIQSRSSEVKLQEPSSLATEILERWQHELSEPPLLGVGDGVPCKVDRTRCLGNSVCPPVATFVAQKIKEVERWNE